MRALLGHFPFVRTNRPDHSSHNEDFTLIKTVQPDQSNALNSMHEGASVSTKSLGKSAAQPVGGIGGVRDSCWGEEGLCSWRNKRGEYGFFLATGKFGKQKKN